MSSHPLPEERPRERLSRGGVEALGEIELIALVLQSGSRGASAVELARALRLRYPTLAELAAASAPELARVAGIGPCRAASICAALELGRRAEHDELSSGQPIGGSQAVFHHFHARLGGLKQERFYVVMLDGKGRLLREVRVSEGSLTASIVHPREVFRAAIREAAAAVLLVHNHPSGDPTPSPEDLSLTSRLRAAGDLVGVKVVDHVIVGRGRYVSFVDNGHF
ncbi:MAG TPA: DNA repair protein RadC [Candidatus Bathyarchaeia archaeon]|nr:DNA repair protein RadC [Candidatus Bathyarchaeia archaeon]